MDDPWAKRCSQAPLLASYSQYLMGHLVAQEHLHLERTTERVLLLVRKPSAIHPDHYHREIGNEADVDSGLISMFLSSQAVSALMVALTKEGREVVEGRPELLSASQQAEMFANADIVISVHAASLSWMLVTSKCAQILEMRASGNHQFQNYAKLTGRQYTCVPDMALEWGNESFDVPVQALVETVSSASTRLKA